VVEEHFVAAGASVEFVAVRSGYDVEAMVDLVSVEGLGKAPGGLEEVIFVAGEETQPEGGVLCSCFLGELGEAEQLVVVEGWL
jgi:hypothetical protein